MARGETKETLKPEAAEPVRPFSLDDLGALLSQTTGYSPLEAEETQVVETPALDKKRPFRRPKAPSARTSVLTGTAIALAMMTVANPAAAHAAQANPDVDDDTRQSPSNKGQDKKAENKPDVNNGAVKSEKFEAQADETEAEEVVREALNDYAEQTGQDVVGAQTALVDQTSAAIEYVEAEVVKVVAEADVANGLQNKPQKVKAAPPKYAEYQAPVKVAATEVAKAPATVEVKVKTPELSDQSVISVGASTAEVSNTPALVKVKVGLPNLDKALKPVKLAAFTVAAENPSLKTVAVQNVGEPEPEYDDAGNQIIAEPILSPAIEVDQEAVLDEEFLTDEQKIVKKAWRAIKEEAAGSEIASILIRENFYDKAVYAAQPTEPTNQALLDKLSGMSASYQELIQNNGHASVDYVNTTRMAYSVIEAMAYDQSVMQSEEIRALLANVKVPEDGYKKKLFNEKYAAQAKELLTADLLANFSEENAKRIQTIITYLLMAGVSDEALNKEVEEIKAAEKKAAEERAAREAQERAGNSNRSVELEAVQDLIKAEKDPVMKRGYKIMEFLIKRTDLTLTQIAGIIGNFHRESGSSLDSGQKQFGGGPGRGLAQWEGGRLVDLINFAASRGTTWDDWDTQLEFLLRELPGRQDTLNILKKKTTLYDASFAFLVRFETPKVVVDAYATNYWGYVEDEAQLRADRGQPFLKGINGQVKKVEKERAEAAKKAEAERQARGGMNFNQTMDMAKDFFYNRQNYLAAMNKFGLRNQCTALVNYFTRRYVVTSEQSGNGRDVAWIFANQFPNLYEMKNVNDITPYTIFSWRKGNGPGHTGMIMETNPDGSIIVMEANVNVGGANGLKAIDAYGTNRSDGNMGKVTVTSWASKEAWMSTWRSYGYHDPSFASPKDPAQIAKNIKNGGHP